MTDMRDFRTDAFLEGATVALAQDGFVTDEHPFAPYRDVVVRNVGEIQDFLRENGANYELGAGELESAAFGPVFFIFDRNRMTLAQATEQVDKWVREGIDYAEA